MDKGILLLALGNPQYGKMAANLAASIRFSDTKTPIHLVYSGNSISQISEEHKKLFNSFSECPAEYYTKNGKTTYLKAKTFAYDLSPFKTTILMDVDLVLFGESKMSELFDTLKNVDFTFQNRGHFDLSKPVVDEHYSMWCNIKQVKEAYNTTGRYYSFASEFIYFKKNEANKAYFDLVKEVFDSPKVSGAIYANGKKIADNFGGDIPDELAFSVASAIQGRYPHKENYVNIHWFAADKKLSSSEIISQYYGLSIGGNNIPDHVMSKYSNICQFYSKKLGLPCSYKIQNKRQFLPERKAI